MGRRPATALHLALSLIGAVLYFVFVIPRWWVLLGAFPTTLATVGRIAAGLPIALAAIPVVLFLQQSLKPENAIPEIALRLRAWSGVLHVVAGVLIAVTAVAEVWVHLETAGPWLFAVYGAAGAIAILAVLAFYLSFIAEQPAAAPKPPKPAKEKKPRGKRKRAESESPLSEPETETTEATPEGSEADAAEESDEPTGGLLNKRPTGKSRKPLRRSAAT
ncbi:MAG: hypothetical protein ACR2JI_14915 [Mycobacterium sp.]